MLSEDIISVQSLTRAPENEDAARAAKRLWLARYMLDGFAAQWRVLNSARPITDRDLYWLAELGELAKWLLCSHKAPELGPGRVGPLPEERARMEPLYKQWQTQLVQLVQNAPLPGKPGVSVEHHARSRATYFALSQQFDGVVKSVTDETVTIEFEVNGDLERRKFRRDQLDVDFPINPGDVATVKCTLELLPPAEYTLSEAEITALKEAEARHRRIREKFRQPPAAEGSEEAAP